MKTLLAHLVGDYIIQNDYMANEKTTSNLPALLHAVTYAGCFIPLTRSPRALLVIGGTHYVIDRYRLAKYGVWARNQLAPKRKRYPFSENKFGGPQTQPDWLAGWLMFIFDNTAHMVINEWAVKKL